jgi:hypothetical protein
MCWNAYPQPFAHRDLRRVHLLERETNQCQRKRRVGQDEWLTWTGSPRFKWRSIALNNFAMHVSKHSAISWLEVINVRMSQLQIGWEPTARARTRGLTLQNCMFVRHLLRICV